MTLFAPSDLGHREQLRIAIGHLRLEGPTADAHDRQFSGDCPSQTQVDHDTSATPSGLTPTVTCSRSRPVLHGPAAPSSYEYNLDLPDGAVMEELAGGFVEIRAADGSALGGVAPPWARDGQGEEVPTHFEIVGHRLTQVVDHSQVSSYPVVADPWLGMALFKNFHRTTWNSDHRYNGTVTVWGGNVMLGTGVVGGYVAGQYIMRTSGWKEWTTKWPAITNKATLKHQFDCHVAAGTYGLPFTGEYNLERARVDNSNWTRAVGTHRCNW